MCDNFEKNHRDEMHSLVNISQNKSLLFIGRSQELVSSYPNSTFLPIPYDINQFKDILANSTNHLVNMIDSNELNDPFLTA